MYKVNYVYIVSGRDITPHDSSIYSLADALKEVDVNTKIILSVYNTSTKKNRPFDFTSFMHSYKDTSYTTWDELSELLTDEYVEGYETYLPGYVAGTNTLHTSLISWDPLNVYKIFNIDYADHETGKYNIQVLRYKLKDIRLSFQETYKEQDKYPDLSHCVPVINGLVCRPTYDKFTDALYGIGGSELCWNGKIPEVQLLEFTELGDIVSQDIVLTPDTSATYTSLINTTFDLTSRWTFYTPLSLAEYTPILVLGGSLIFPDEITYLNEHKFIFYPHTYQLGKTISYRAYCRDMYGTRAEINYPGNDPISYLTQAFTEGYKGGDTFVLYVKTNKLFVTRTKVTAWRRGLTVDLYSENGLLQRENTRTIHTYHATQYVDRKQLDLQPVEEMFFTEYLKDQKQSLIIDPDCEHYDPKLLGSSSFRMLYLIK